MKRNIILSLVALFLCTSFVKADDDLYQRVVLLEEFTTEKCANCPSRTQLVNEIMDSVAYQGKIVAVYHHSGFYSDFLTLPADEDYKWFYNYKSTYAPALMFDRYPYFETKGRPGSGQRKPTPVSDINNRHNITKYLDRRLADKPHVGFYLIGQYDNDKTITVRMSGVRDSMFCNTDPRVTVYVVENHVEAENQAGAQGVFFHNHVMRAYNSVWGDVLTWNGDTFEYECQLPVEPEWNKDYIQVVAFVHSYDSEDPGNCAVENTRVIDFQTILGIEDAQTHKEVKDIQYFTLDGVHTTPLTDGIYVQKTTYSDGSVETQKIIK